MDKRKITNVITVLVLSVLLAGILLVSAFAGKPEVPGKPAQLDTDENGFSCHTFDERGNAVYAYRSEKDGVWYLFVPSTVKIPELVLSYTGSVAEASGGVLDARKCVVTGGFAASGDRITLTGEDNTVHTVQVMQSDLPSVHIVLSDTTLDEIHGNKDVKHTENSVYIMDPSGSYNLTVEGTVEMKGRGNTTWKMFDKRAYQIKFASKISVLGMGKAKKWVLLANAGDDSMMRTMLTYRMAKNLDMAFVPSFVYADLWVDGEYLGTYIIGEKIEPGKSRLNMKSGLGIIFEQDEAYYAEEEYRFSSELLQRHFVMKEIVEEEEACISEAIQDFKQSLDTFAKYLYFTPSPEATLEELSTMIDVDSFVKYYLVAEYVLNREAIGSSFFWYKDGPEDVIHMGPIWDYDTCMGNDGPTYTENYAHYYLVFRYLLAIPEYYERTMELREQYRPYMDAMDEDADVLRAQIAASAEMNYLRWDVLGKPTNKDGRNFADTFDGAVDSVQDWLRGRETAFSVPQSVVIYTSVSSDGKTMEVYCDDRGAYDNVAIAVWGVANEQNDLQWYPADRDESGVLRVSVDLTKHNETGAYMLSGYSGDLGFAKGMSFVQMLTPQLNATVSPDGETMTLSYADGKDHLDIRFSLWSEEGGQDDMQWYTAEKNVYGKWTCNLDLRAHDSMGKYIIHIYSVSAKGYTKLYEHSLVAAEAVTMPVTVDISEDKGIMTITYLPEEQHTHVHFAVWSKEDGQDDLEWYASRENADGEWVYTVNLKDHSSAGVYNIHVYAIQDGDYNKLIEHIVEVSP